MSIKRDEEIICVICWKAIEGLSEKTKARMQNRYAIHEECGKPLVEKGILEHGTDN